MSSLVESGLSESREQAQRAIMAGKVRSDGHPARKASDKTRDEDTSASAATEKYLSRGGHKLERLPHHFAFDANGLTGMDPGALTGGFTDCLPQHGAVRVFAQPARRAHPVDRQQAPTLPCVEFDFCIATSRFPRGF